MFRLPNVDQKLQGIIQDKIEVLDDFSMAHFLKDENIKLGKWKNVQRVTMRNSQVTDKAIQMLCSNPVSEQIEQLELQRNFSAINDNTMQIISKSNFMINLRYLDLSDDSVTDDGISFLMASRASKNLHTLLLFGNVQVTSESLKSIAASRECKSLQKLDLRSTYINDQGIKDLSQSKNSLNLKDLNLAMNVEAITDESMVFLSMSKYLTNLTILNMSNCSVTDEGMWAICNSPNFSNLIDLDLSNDNSSFDLNNISDKSLEYLADTTYITNLEKLNLRGLRVTSFGINLFTLSYNIQNLQYLRLSQCQGITDKTLEALVKASTKSLKNLNKLYLNETKVTEKGIRYIMKALPALDIVYDFRLFIQPDEDKVEEDNGGLSAQISTRSSNVSKVPVRFN